MLLQAIAQRVATALTILLLVSVGSFALVYLAPGDPALVIAAQRIGRMPQPDEIATVRAAYGLDQPPVVQYLRWVGQVLRGDLGRSIRTGIPIAETLGQLILPTLALAGATLAGTLMIGLPLGMLAALRAGSWVDQVIRLGALLSVAMPQFWLAFLLVLIFAITLGWLPSFGLRGPASFVLPVLTLGLANAARLSQLTRSLILEERGKPYLRTARAKGLPEWMIWWGHALPTIAVPVITLCLLQVSSIAIGTVIVESVFAWPGVGRYFLEAVENRDLPVIQAMSLVFAVVFIGAGLLAEVAHAISDPRTRAR
jgi:ABC-type dipeptide/oligopeptide/nickel transport system permease component